MQILPPSLLPLNISDSPKQMTSQEISQLNEWSVYFEMLASRFDTMKMSLRLLRKLT